MASDKSPLRVFYRSSGGFAGLVREAQVGSAQMSTGEAQQLGALVAQALECKPSAISNEQARDVECVELEIQQGQQVQRLQFASHAVPQQARGLVELLRKRAKSPDL